MKSEYGSQGANTIQLGMLLSHMKYSNNTCLSEKRFKDSNWTSQFLDINSEDRKPEEPRPTDWTEIRSYHTK